MSLWRRLFKKDQTLQTATRPLTLKEQYQRKVQLYSEIVTTTNAALEILAQMQARLHKEDYFSPAYLRLNCAIICDHARRVVRMLERFTKGQYVDASSLLAKIEGQINDELTNNLKSEFTTTGLPFEQDTLSTPELLASGVVYPAREEDSTETLKIKAVWGWWPAMQNGLVRARRYRVRQNQVTEVTLPETGPQEQWLTYRPEQGFYMAAIPEKIQEQSCLQDSEALKIVQYYRLLRVNYPKLQELEWGLGPHREVIILRSRRSGRPQFQDATDKLQSSQVLSSHGITIYPGMASGPAFRVDVDHLPDNLDIPSGVVLLVKKPALCLGPFLSKIAALVVETGEPHNHLAFLVRERHLPAIFDIGQDTSLFPEGMIISVDAQSPQVVAGTLEPLAAETEKKFCNPFLAAKMLDRLSFKLFSLNPGLSGETSDPETCQSIHDLLYYASAIRRKEMFCLSLKSEVGKKDTVSLVTGRLVPIAVIGAGDSIAVERPSITLEEIHSIPFRAFLEGMLSIPWPKARPLDVKGFISVIGVTSTTPHAEDQLRKVSFALITQDYMNFSLCLGYHASTIEAFIGNNLDNNFIRFHYQGGAASIERRLRRLQLIGEILTRLGFKVTLQGDLLDGLQVGDPEPILLKKLSILGRLEVFTKQMDMVMADDASVLSYIHDFLEKHCLGLQV